jgi:hypothetical protein
MQDLLKICVPERFLSERLSERSDGIFWYQNTFTWLNPHFGLPVAVSDLGLLKL